MSDPDDAAARARRDSFRPKGKNKLRRAANVITAERALRRPLEKTTTATEQSIGPKEGTDHSSASRLAPAINVAASDVLPQAEIKVPSLTPLIEVAKSETPPPAEVKNESIVVKPSRDSKDDSLAATSLSTVVKVVRSETPQGQAEFKTEAVVSDSKAPADNKWVVMTANVYGVPYFYNISTGESSWSRPDYVEGELKNAPPSPTPATSFN